MKRAIIVTAFLTNQDLILILKRSKYVKTMKCKWGGVSGYVENGEEPLDAAIREIEEETGIDRSYLKVLSKGRIIEVYDSENNVVWIVHPFLIHTNNTEIKLSKEHEEYRWIKPEDINKYDTVPKLSEALYSCLDSYSSYKKA